MFVCKALVVNLMECRVALIPGFASSTKKPAWQEVIETLTTKGTINTPHYTDVIPLELYSEEGALNPASDYNINTPIFNPAYPDEKSLARKILSDLESALPGTEGKLHIIAHSTGGLVIRSILKWLLEPSNDGSYYIKNHRITSIVFLASPHRGTPVADKFFARLLHIGVETVFSSFGLAKSILQGSDLPVISFSDGEMAQLRTKSAFLQALNSDGMLIPGIKFINAVGSGGRRVNGWLLNRYLFGKSLFGLIPTFLFPSKNDGLVPINSALMKISEKEYSHVLSKSISPREEFLFNIYLPKIANQISHSELLLWQSYDPAKQYRDRIFDLLREDCESSE